MKNLKKEQNVYLSDDMYIPISYKGATIEKPQFKGKGNHSVAQLCTKFEEYCHQQAIMKQNCMKRIVEFKFSRELN